MRPVMRNSALRLFVSVFSLLIASSALAYNPGIDALLFKPATDGGRYLETQQSNGLYQWGYNFGFTGDYAFEPVQMITAASSNRVRGVVDDLAVANFYGAFGLTDWWEIGVNVPVVGWETFYDPNALLNVLKKETVFGLGDVRLDMKFRLVDIDRHHFGVSILPFAEFPTGNSRTYRGNEQFTGGGMLALETRIGRKFFFAINAGYQVMDYQIYDPATPNAIIDDLLLLRAGAHYDITDAWGLLGEVYGDSVTNGFLRNQLQNPAEFLGGVRFTSQKAIKGLSVTAAGGRGITTGFGAAGWRALVQINYRHSDVVSLVAPPPPPPVILEAATEEKIAISQRIHFEFNRAVIRPISYPILDDVFAVLQRNPQILKIKIEGHTDSVGGAAYNQKLSEKRALAVREYLLRKGIDAARLTSAGFGKSRPIADNESAEGRAKNRRTEFTILESK